jgi:hypothetical protein
VSSFRRGQGFFLLVLPFLLIPILITSSGAQGLQTSPYSAADSVRRGSSEGLDLRPSNPLGLPGSTSGPPRGSDSIFLSDRLLQGIFPLIPNLQLGYLYNFGQNVNSDRLTLDYILPVGVTRSSTVFGEAHTEFQDFWKILQGEANHRVDVSLGGGYRRMLANKTLVGVNGFYDTTRLGGTWYSSGSVGCEMAAEIAGNDAIDLNFNWYGQLFNSSVISNAFRYGPSNFDFQAGYSHELYNGGPDLRLSATGYKFESWDGVYGYNAGAELKSRDGVLVLKYQIGHDKINQTYHTVGGFVNVGFQPERVLSGESPFTMPEPIFRSPRNLWSWMNRSLSSTRNWSQPASVVLHRNEQGGGGSECGCGGSCHGLVYGATFVQHAAVVNTGLSYFIPFHTKQISVCDLNTNVAGNKRRMSIWFRGRVTGGSVTIQINVMHAVPSGGGYNVTWSPVYGFWFPTIPVGYHDFTRIVDQVVLDEVPGNRGIEVMRQAGLDAIGVFVQKAAGAGQIVGSAGQPWHFHVEFNEP